MAITEAPVRYADASTVRVTADNAIEYAYRDLGESDVPLVYALDETKTWAVT